MNYIFLAFNKDTNGDLMDRYTGYNENNDVL